MFAPFGGVSKGCVHVGGVSAPSATEWSLQFALRVCKTVEEAARMHGAIASENFRRSGYVTPLLPRLRDAWPRVKADLVGMLSPLTRPRSHDESATATGGEKVATKATARAKQRNETTTKRKRTANEVMREKAAKDGECRLWSTRKWAEATGFSPSTIFGTPCYQEWGDLREVVKAEKKLKRLQRHT